MTTMMECLWKELGVMRRRGVEVWEVEGMATR
jgi:hypothetical protein